MATFYIFPHPFWIGFAVIAQCPANCLVNEEFALSEVVIENLCQQGGIGFFFAQSLVVNGNAAQPDIIITAPVENGRIGFGITQGNVADDAVEKVDAVPP